MGYGNTFSKLAIIHRGMGWYDVEQLLEVMHKIWKINFNIVEQRAQALAALNNLSTLAPYSRNVRFPEGKYYITLASGDWIRKLQQLRISLSYKPNQKEKKIAASTPTDSEHQDANDAILAFQNCISSIITQLGQLGNIYDREMFESKYSLVWTNQEV